MGDATGELTGEDVIDYVGETYAGRGQNYFYDDRIAAAKVHERSIRALCYGSKPEPYEVRVGLEGPEIRWSTCTCPVPEPCKHVAALLYTYIEKPERFRHPAQLRRELQGREKAELVDLVMELADWDPEVERHLEERLLASEEPEAGESEASDGDVPDLSAEAAAVEALLEAGEVDRAERRARMIDVSYEFGEALDRFVAAGHPERAEALARTRLAASGGGRHDHGVQAWLVGYYDDQGRPRAALDIMCRMFEQHPTPDRYRRVEQLARRAGGREAYVETARAILRDEAPRGFLRLALEEGDLQAAVDIWREIAGEWTPRTWKSSDLELELARATESVAPEIAADIYAAEAGMLAKSGGRDSYRRAVDLLERCERILGEADREQRWLELRDGFVGEHGSKRTLVEMMESAGLV